MRRARLIAVWLIAALAAVAPGAAVAKTHRKPKPRPKLLRVGPPLPTGTGLTRPCAFQDPDCEFVNWSLPTGISARISANGTIIGWRAEALQGSARLLVFKKTPDGVYTLVGRSRIRTVPCVYDPTSATCGPALGTVSWFPAHLKVKTGEWIGIELISAPNCVTMPDNDTCAEIGLFDGTDAPIPQAQIDYFDPTPPMYAQTRSSDFNQEGELAVNAVVQVAPPKPKRRNKHHH